MATTTTLPFLPLLFSFLFLITPSLSDPSTPTDPTTACLNTPDPPYCKSLLQPTGGNQNLYSYGRFSLSKSLSHAYKLTAAVDRYLSRQSSFPLTAVRVLDDCHLLFDLNVDFLTSSGSTVNSTTTALAESQADTLHSQVSAILTNLQTCLDELETTPSASDIMTGLSDDLSNGSKLYGVSLALFKQAWVPNSKPKLNRGFIPSRVPHKGKIPHEANVDGRLSLKMSTPNRKLFESRTGRRLLQSSNAVLVSSMVVVSKNGTGNFTTITDAVSSAPNNTDGSKGYYLIFVTAGVYQEYVSVPKNKKYLMMIGDGINRTVITGSHNNVDGWTTFNSATFAVVGQGFVGINMTFQNTAGAAKHQAVAVRNGADLSAFYSCSFEGYQDTLYTHSLRQFYRECDIYGTVDYIFGNAAVVFQNCNIYSRLPMSGQQNTITAQGRTDPNQNTGTSIQGCNVKAAADLAANGGSTKTYLGRPWKEYSRTVFMQSDLGSLIDPAGWLPWNGTFAFSTLYYAEFNNSGPGSNTSGRVTWPGYHRSINASDAVNFTVTNFIMGDNWLPQTGVPLSSGLL